MADNEKTEPREALFDINEIPKEFKGVTLDDATRTQLSYGQWSPLLRNLELEAGIVKDGKIRLVPDGKKGFKIAADLKEEKLVIEPVIHGHKLTQQEREDLEKNKVIGPLKLKEPSDEKFFLQVDQELNTVTISTPEGIGVPERIGNYNLTDKDQNTLANGGQMSARVFETEQGYFMANVSLSKDGKGLTYSNIKDLTKEQALELIPKHNIDKTNIVSKIASATEQAVAQKAKGKETTPTPEISNTAKANDQTRVGSIAKPVAASIEASERQRSTAIEKKEIPKPDLTLTAEQIKILDMADKAKAISREPKTANQKPLEVPKIGNTQTDKMIAGIHKVGSDTNKVLLNTVLQSNLSEQVKAEVLVAVSYVENNDALKMRANIDKMETVKGQHIEAIVQNSNLSPTQKSVFQKAFGDKTKVITNDREAAAKGHEKNKAMAAEKKEVKKKKNQKQKSKTKPAKARGLR